MTTQFLRKNSLEDSIKNSFNSPNNFSILDRQNLKSKIKREVKKKIVRSESTLSNLKKLKDNNDKMDFFLRKYRENPDEISILSEQIMGIKNLNKDNLGKYLNDFNIALKIAADFYSRMKLDILPESNSELNEIYRALCLAYDYEDFTSKLFPSDSYVQQHTLNRRFHYSSKALDLAEILSDNEKLSNQHFLLGNLNYSVVQDKGKKNSQKEKIDTVRHYLLAYDNLTDTQKKGINKILFNDLFSHKKISFIDELSFVSVGILINKPDKDTLEFKFGQ